MDIYNIIENSKKIVIYGAGNWASEFYTYLKFKKMDDKVFGFAVHSMNGNKSEVFDKKVFAIDDIKDEIINADIIIAIKKDGDKRQEDLKKYNFKSICYIKNEINIKMQNEIFDFYAKLPIKRNKIVFNSFNVSGREYSCNCKYITEELIRGKYPVEIIWVINDINNNNIPKEIKAVQINSLEYYKEVWTAGILITNGSSISFIKRPEQYYISTWHGSGPFKKVGISLNKTKTSIEKFTYLDLFISNSGDNSNMCRESFLCNAEIYECGSPRNDIFFKETNFRNVVCERLGIPANKKIVLYAPTYRGRLGSSDITKEWSSFENYDIEIEGLLCSLKKKFDSDFVLVYRFHHNILKYEQCNNFFDNAINATNYSDTQELLVAADVLITDYSSIMWDFSLQIKPVYLYQKDAEEYDSEYGFYCPMNEWPYPRAHTNEELCKIVEDFDNDKYIADLNKFIETYKSFDDGHASEKVVLRIMDVINNPEKYGKA